MKKGTIVIICSGLLVAAYLATFGIRTARVETFRNLVSKNLKVGASSDQVAAFLDSQHLEHSGMIKPTIMGLGGHDYPGENVIVAIRRGTWRNVLQTESIEFVFVFSEKRELVRFDVFPVYTGL